MLNNDVFVFDNVVHMYDLSDDNLIGASSSADRRGHLTIGSRMRGETDGTRSKTPTNPGIGHGYDRRWTVHDLARVVFADGITDMAMAQAVVLYDVYKDGFAPMRAQYEFAQAYPDKVLFCGGVDPLYLGGNQSVGYAMTRQVLELGARSFKFYNGHLDNSWRCDDRELAYPMYEQAQELGIKVLQFHKGFPITRAPLETLSPLDIERAAVDFPDMVFAIHHLALPYFEECVYMAARHANIVLVLSGTMHLPFIAPWDFKTYIGRLLRDVGSDRVLWGSEAPLTGPPRPAVEWFWNMQIDEELQDRHGYPPISEDDKRNILGLNQARLFGVDPRSVIQSTHLGVTGGDTA
ncbi:amidohydrolase family protein [Mycobacterium stomatepiae]|uniref:Amidohydrolase n=1 Tax=Mycobacterium stomatepiae TaxID=470076 RepID=A0A7I7QB15_9MYCO|nr:amidohydrolase family protein [Mycobacterium stomatepiae]MCV7164074.1 amidohydrolase family protein [Mycobacterium stomatepiae]BBY23449.1 amidohydrolase [Mycobacterium stomatepiae]